MADLTMFQGETKVIRIKTKAGNPAAYVDPGIFGKIEVFITNRYTQELVAQYISPFQNGYKSISIEGDPDNYFDIHLDISDTATNKVDLLDVQVNYYVANDDFQGGYQKFTQKGTLAQLLKAYNA